MYSIKKVHAVWATIICIVGFAIPFLLKSEQDSWNSVFSLSLTVIGTLLTIATLIIAVLLYDRFGINSKFKEHQVDKVIELAILLKKTNITVSTNQFTYFIHRSQEFISRRNEFLPYKNDGNKTLLFPDNCEELFSEINVIRNDYWLPKEIKDKMKFLEIFGLDNVENSMDEHYARLDINNNAKGAWMVSFPKLTFEMLNINIYELIKEIENWLKKHSTIPIDLKLE